MILKNSEKFKKKEEKLLHQYQVIIGSTTDMIALLSNNYIYLAVNQAYLNAFGKKEDQIIGKSVVEVFGEEMFSKIIKPNADNCLAGNKIQYSEWFKFPVSGKLYMDINYYPYFSPKNEIQGFIVNGRNITKRKNAEDELKELNRKLRSVREDEKLHLAREIHDELGQVITYCKLELLWIIKEIKTPGEKIDKKLASMVSHLDNCLASIRRISSELRPQILDVMGISEALKWQAQKFKDQTHIKFKLNILPERIECGRDMSVDLFRVFQEILTNISRHAEASLVQINFLKEENHYCLIVKDNGKGFNITSANDVPSFGILGIRERAAGWGGRVNIESLPGLGTTITVNIPCMTSVKRGPNEVQS